MEGTTEDCTTDLGHSLAVKAALHYTVGGICENVGTEYGVTFSKGVIASISEFINHQIEIYAIDLEAFAKHAKRTTINLDDVKLLARRNPKLKETVKGICDSLEASGSGVGKKVKKRKIDASKGETEKDASKREPEANTEAEIVVIEDEDKV